MFIAIPDNVLEKLTCDICQKYLSVGPVTVDGNHEKRCGRCATSSDSQTLSVYRFFGENAVFKCINRFDGCSVLLSYNEALEHEKTCTSKAKYQCPLCNVATPKIYDSFQLIQHFKNMHDTYYLGKPFFKIKVGKIMKKIFLYSKENHMFIIFFEYQNCNQALLLNTYFVGYSDDTGVNGQQKYKLHIEEDQEFLECETKPCLPLHMLQDESSAAPIIFQPINITMESELTIYFELGDIVVYGGVLLKEKTRLVRPETRKIEIVSKENWFKKYSSLNITISDCGTKLLKVIEDEIIEINLNCLICSTISLNNVYITNEGNIRSLICKICINMCKQSCQYFDELLGTKSDIFQFLRFSCKWNCPKYNMNFEINSHERCCHKSSPIKCPCCCFSGTFKYLQQHLKDNHNVTLPETPVYAITCNRFDGAHSVTRPYIWMQQFNVMIKICCSSENRLNSIGGYVGAFTYSWSQKFETKLCDENDKRDVFGILKLQDQYIPFKNSFELAPVGPVKIYFTSVTE